VRRGCRSRSQSGGALRCLAVPCSGSPTTLPYSAVLQIAQSTCHLIRFSSEKKMRLQKPNRSSASLIENDPQTLHFSVSCLHVHNKFEPSLEDRNKLLIPIHTAHSRSATITTARERLADLLSNPSTKMSLRKQKNASRATTARIATARVKLPAVNSLTRNAAEC